MLRCNTLSVRNPKKSILSNPHFSTVGPSYCVSTLPSLSRYSGTSSSSGCSAITTPAA